MILELYSSMVLYWAKENDNSCTYWPMELFGLSWAMLWQHGEQERQDEARYAKIEAVEGTSFPGRGCATRENRR